MSSFNIKDKLDGNQLDLSMMSLKDVPLKEIASVPRATTLDLSSNQLKSLPPSFGTQLSHIIKLDLSANKLQSLPKSFHLLVNLKHLDLYNNQLTDLPVSLHHLNRLRFLDIKNNPLEPKLQSIVGDCLTKKECETAAKRLIGHFTKQKQFAIDQEILANKEKEAREQKLREEAEAERLKLEKKMAKKERKNENKSQKQQAALELQQQQQQQQRQASQAQGSSKTANGSAAKSQKKAGKGSSKRSGGSSLMSWINTLLFACITAAAGWCLFLHLEGDYSQAGFKAALPRLEMSAMRLRNLTVEALQPDNLRKTGSVVAKSANATAYEAAAAVQRAAYASQAYLEVYTGDLTPYTSAVARAYGKAYVWTSEQASVAGRWIMKQDWQGMWDTCVAFVSAVAAKLQEWWAEALKNPTVASIWDAVCLNTNKAIEWLRQTLLLTIAYLQENGPVWLALVRDNTYSAVLSVKESVQALIK